MPILDFGTLSKTHLTDALRKLKLSCDAEKPANEAGIDRRAFLAGLGAAGAAAALPAPKPFWPGTPGLSGVMPFEPSPQLVAIWEMMDEMERRAREMFTIPPEMLIEGKQSVRVVAEIQRRMDRHIEAVFRYGSDGLAKAIGSLPSVPPDDGPDVPAGPSPCVADDGA